MPTLGNAYVQILPSAQGISGKIKEAIGGSLGSAGTEQGNLFGSKFAAMAKTAIAAAGIGKIVKDALSQGGELEQSIGGIETLFGAKGAKDVSEYASMVGKTVSEVKGEYYDLMRGQDIALSNASVAWRETGLSANEYMQNISGFAAALNASLGGDTVASAKAANQAMVDMADNSNKMGTSMESIQTAYQGFAKQNYTMLDNLKLGYGGTKTEMQRLLADASKLSGVKYDISNLSDVYAAIHVVQTELGITGTTAKEAQSTLQGSAKAMGAAWKDLLGNMAIGGDVKTAMSNLASSASTYLFGNLLPMAGNIAQSIPGTIVTAVQTGLPILQEQGKHLVESLKTGLTTQLPELINQGLPMLLSFTSGLRGNIGQLVDVGIDLVNSLVDGFVAGMPAMIEDIPGIVSNVANIINDNAPKIILAGIEIIVKLATAIWDNRNLIISNMGNIGQAALDVVAAINWLNLGKTIITFIRDGIFSLAEIVPTLVKSIGNKAFEWFRSIDWLGLGKTVIGYVRDGVHAVFSIVPTLVKSIGTQAFNWFKSIDWSGLGQAVINLIKDGITSLVNAIPDGIKAIGNSAYDLFKGIDWSGLGQTVINLLRDGVNALATAVPDALSSIASSALDAVKGIDWLGLGSDVVSGVVSGIKSAGGAIADTLTDMARDAWASVKSFFRIGSPSKLMRDTIGKQIPAGMALGIKAGSKDVIDAMDYLEDQTRRTMISDALVRATYSGSQTGSMPAVTAYPRGITQNLTINSPRELTPSETARQTRNATQELLLSVRGV